MANKISILTKNQKLFLNELKKSEELRTQFYLTGGTALAEFYFHHRLSEDLDLFSTVEYDLDNVELFVKTIKEKLQPQRAIFERKNGRSIFTFIFMNDILKVEFVHYRHENLRRCHEFDGLIVNDLYDIAVNKLFSIYTRNEPKDYVDLFFLLGKFSVESLLNGVEKKFGFKLETFSLGNELFKARRITSLPKMLKKLSLEELKAFYLDEAKKLGAIIF